MKFSSDPISCRYLTTKILLKILQDFHGIRQVQRLFFTLAVTFLFSVFFLLFLVFLFFLFFFFLFFFFGEEVGKCK